MRRVVVNHTPDMVVIEFTPTEAQLIIDWDDGGCWEIDNPVSPETWLAFQAELRRAVGRP
jgi:hypothetical protein